MNLIKVSLGKNIVVVGREADAITFISWFKKMDIRSEISLITDTEYPGVIRSKLPLIVLEETDPLSSIIYQKNFLERILLVKIINHPDLTRLNLDNILSRSYDKVVITSISQPRINIKDSVHLVRIEDAIQLREMINEGCEEIEVYGGLWGIWPATLFSSRKFPTVLYVEDKDFYKEYFDTDIWNIILKESNYKFKIKIVDLSAISYDPKKVKVIYGFERPLLRGITEEYRDKISAIGSSTITLDKLINVKFFHISEHVSLAQARMLALELLGFHAFGCTRFFQSKMGEMFIASCGFNKESLEKYNIKTSVTRMRLPLYDENGTRDVEIIIKGVAHRYSRKLLGFQIISTSSLVLEYIQLAYMVLMLGGTLNEIISMVSSYIPKERYFHDPLYKTIYSLWSKTLEYG
ncbi:MAG: hypothetical protein DRJ64_01245 [Thermoprotei archaeon]|nr:MAG: hypothetical protein DRJ64_01245 [Thermoprotei archaeon]